MASDAPITTHDSKELMPPRKKSPAKKVASRKKTSRRPVFGFCKRSAKDRIAITDWRIDHLINPHRDFGREQWEGYDDDD